MMQIASSMASSIRPTQIYILAEQIIHFIKKIRDAGHIKLPLYIRAEAVFLVASDLLIHVLCNM